MAVVGQRALDHPVEAVGRHAERAEPRGHARAARFSASSSSARSAAVRQPHRRLQPRELAADRRRVEPHHQRHQDRVQRAVVQPQVLQPAERVAERMHRAEPLLERQPALERAHHHLGPRREVAAVGTSPFEVAPDPPGAVERDRLGRRIVARRQERLDAVRQRVEPGRRGEPRRQPEGQLRIADRPLRDQVRADEAELAAVGERQQRRPPDLRAGPRRRRDGDHRRDRRGDPRRARRRSPHTARAALRGSRAAPRPWRDRSASRRRAPRCRRSPSRARPPSAAGTASSVGFGGVSRKHGASPQQRAGPGRAGRSRRCPGPRRAAAGAMPSSATRRGQRRELARPEVDRGQVGDARHRDRRALASRHQCRHRLALSESIQI